MREGLNCQSSESASYCLSQVLLIEDDKSLSDVITDYLRDKGFAVKQIFTGENAVETILQLNPDVVIVDGMLPLKDGIDICREVRDEFKGRIIMLTARDQDEDEIAGLDVGADDYLCKPVRAQVLVARIMTQIRQLQRNIADEKIASDALVFGNLLIHSASRTVELCGQNVSLSSNEFDTLLLLASRAGDIVSRDSLSRHLRGFDYDGFDRSTDLKISRLRKKLGDTSTEPKKIVTVWGKGYLFVKEAWI